VDDPYEVLGVPTDATTDEIHDAYRRLARRTHPDMGGADAVEMAKINEAWRALRSPASRARSDAAQGARDASPPMPFDEDPYDLDSQDTGTDGRWLRLMLVAVMLTTVVVLIAIFLIGFGRFGVSHTP
jgi:curved DNA-binding protein CbpA